MIRCQNVSKHYPQGEGIVKALDGVSFDLKQGQHLTILGPSGSGKTTLMNLLGALDTPTAGAVFFGADDIALMSASERTALRKKHIGFIFQHYHLLPTLTVYENVALGYHLHPGSHSIETMLEAVGLTDRAHHFPHQLSGGEQQRVAIARALIKEPSVLLCDEPTGALDESTGKTILALLATLNQRFQTTLIIITHHRGIATMSDRIMTLNSGRLISDVDNAHKREAHDIVWS